MFILLYPVTLKGLTPTAKRLINGNNILKNSNTPQFKELIHAFEHNIEDETGEGDPEKSHAKLFNNSYATLSKKLFDTKEITGNVLNSTRKLHSESLQMFSSNVYEMLGACMAQETHALPQLIRLFEGCQKIENECSMDEWRDISHFYDIHLDGTESRHAEDLNNTVWEVLDNRDKINSFLNGYSKLLESLDTFWEGINSTISQK